VDGRHIQRDMLAAQALSDIDEPEKQGEKDESICVRFKMCTVTVCLYSTARTAEGYNIYYNYLAKVMIMYPKIKLGP
jgi:hypothetical protein